ncbi:MAG: hypothetical protein R2725_15995 [Solirubrobacterales bacterium]
MSSPALQALFPETKTVERPPASTADGAPLLDRAQAVEPFVVRLDRMSPRQRLQVYRDGAFNREERTRWACRYPEEVPTINGEVEWIALASADLD